MRPARGTEHNAPTSLHYKKGRQRARSFSILPLLTHPHLTPAPSTRTIPSTNSTHRQICRPTFRPPGPPPIPPVGQINLSTFTMPSLAIQQQHLLLGTHRSFACSGFQRWCLAMVTVVVRRTPRRARGILGLCHARRAGDGAVHLGACFRVSAVRSVDGGFARTGSVDTRVSVGYTVAAVKRHVGRRKLGAGRRTFRMRVDAKIVITGNDYAYMRRGVSRCTSGRGRWLTLVCGTTGSV